MSTLSAGMPASQTESGTPLNIKEMRQVVMCMDRIPQTNHRGLPLGPAASMKAGRSTFGAAPRFGTPLYMGAELSKESSSSFVGRLGQGMQNVQITRDGKPLNLGKAVKHPSITGFGMDKRFKDPSALDDKGPQYYDAKCVRNGLPIKLRPDSTPAFAKSTRGVNLYEGKEHNTLRGVRGLFGPGGYNVRCSRNGSPLKLRPQSTPSFGKGQRFPTKKDYLVDHPRVLDPSKARAFGIQSSSMKRTGSTPTFGNSTRDQVDKLHINKAFFSTPPNAAKWVDPRA
jgi:hypothetical protein